MTQDAEARFREIRKLLRKLNKLATRHDAVPPTIGRVLHIIPPGEMRSDAEMKRKGVQLRTLNRMAKAGLLTQVFTSKGVFWRRPHVIRY